VASPPAASAAGALRAGVAETGVERQHVIDRGPVDGLSVGIRL
jgi:hypothetical protein